MPETFFGWGEWIKDLFSRVELKFFGVISNMCIMNIISNFGSLWNSVEVCACACVYLAVLYHNSNSECLYPEREAV